MRWISGTSTAREPKSFGQVALQYDRYRPTCPDALMDDLAGLRPAQVVDVGCGTGHVATAVASRGLSVLGVEPDEQMAAAGVEFGKLRDSHDLIEGQETLRYRRIGER